ncbi:penicillin-binding transpeptidase domain-containing protein [Paenibacillus turpanensis]|uniref:penicillin-binding transpeptidase domain-containing protein n=1 Tax=Paenibacillus turpanensis TaxID=2689078 RepID=UPI00140E33B9|nr:penicillin-binding transpeptidase domain-containing protein [Paenibacillus turpanensis]
MTKKIRARTLLIGGIFTLFFAVLVARVYWVQIVEASQLVEEAEQMWKTQKTLQPKRGTIFDRKDQILAKNAQAFTVAVNPQTVSNEGIADEIVKGLAPILNKPETDLLALVTKRNSNGELLRHVEIRREGWKIDPETADKVRELIAELKEEHNIQSRWWDGLFLIEDERRYYPKDSLASQILGFTYLEDERKPDYGLEAAYDSFLRGVPGKLLYERDGGGMRVPGSKMTIEPPVDGKDIHLTIDQNIQHYLEAALQKSYLKYQPKSLTGIAMDPKTGEILAMANFPNFDPNQYWSIPGESVLKNHAIASVYEPGSTFKLVTLTGAINEGVFQPGSDFQSGSIKVPGAVIHDHNYVGWGKISYLEGLLRSSNVAMVKLGYETLKEEKMRSYIDLFGFGQKTGLDLPGEARGLVRFKYPADIAAATFGQGGILATPLQLVSSYAAIANGGKLMEPHIVRKVTDPATGQIIEEHQPKAIRDVVSPEVAATVSGYLEKVVSDPNGTGRKAAIEGYKVAGKTGTASKVINGKYDESGLYMISFIGYAPVEDPKIVIGIFADEPDIGGNYHNGGGVTLPAFQEAMSRSLHYLGAQPTLAAAGDQAAAGTNAVSASNAVIEMVKVPDFKGKTPGEAKKEAGVSELSIEVLGKGGTVISQYPVPGKELASGSTVYALTVDKAEAPIPDMTGQSIRDALEICTFLGISCEVTGEGYVYNQETAFGASDVEASDPAAESQGSAVRALRLELRPAGEWLQKKGKEEKR